ncbi:MAG TPA: hypothetical protein VLE53_17315 [Gemmatimonadaceae bacterium]|nr:hypothetical protein [Gemmatimonadaceae bacterium]
MPLSRRSFLGWLGALAATVGLRRRAHASPTPALSGAAEPPETREAAAQGSGLDVALLTKLGEVVLPGELGADGTARVARGFAQWSAGYRARTELVHPYGSATIRVSGEPPAPRWRLQLQDLQREARARHRRAFSALTAGERRELVSAAILATERGERLPDPIAATHVATALMAWYFRSPEAADLCYRARIGKQQCRPLVNSPREPLPLAPRAARSDR